MGLGRARCAELTLDLGGEYASAERELDWRRGEGLRRRLRDEWPEKFEEGDLLSWRSRSGDLERGLRVRDVERERLLARPLPLEGAELPGRWALLSRWSVMVV